MPVDRICASRCSRLEAGASVSTEFIEAARCFRLPSVAGRAEEAVADNKVGILPYLLTILTLISFRFSPCWTLTISSTSFHSALSSAVRFVA